MILWELAIAWTWWVSHSLYPPYRPVIQIRDTSSWVPADSPDGETAFAGREALLLIRPTHPSPPDIKNPRSASNGLGATASVGIDSRYALGATPRHLR